LDGFVALTGFGGDSFEGFCVAGGDSLEDFCTAGGDVFEGFGNGCGDSLEGFFGGGGDTFEGFCSGGGGFSTGTLLLLVVPKARRGGLEKYQPRFSNETNRRAHNKKTRANRVTTNPCRGCGAALALALPVGDLLAILVARAAAIDLGLGAAAFNAGGAGAATSRRFPAHLAKLFTESNLELGTVTLDSGEGAAAYLGTGWGGDPWPLRGYGALVGVIE
jgi:hypothetical protein